MESYPALNKALVIDPSGELRDFLRFCSARLWPKLEIVSYLWARGCPDETFDWSGFDLVVLEHRLHDPRARGIEWVRALRRNPAVPPIVLSAVDVTEDLRTEARNAGAAAVLNKDDLSPRRFAECVRRALCETEEDSGAVEETTSAVDSPENVPESVVADIPGFRIVRPIATTSRGYVSLAAEEGSHQTVVLKVIRLIGGVELSLLRRFTHEYTVLSYLQNPNVMKFFTHGFAKNCAFIAMECCTGGDLRHRIRRGIAPGEALDYLVQIMRALKSVHGRGILHRDIKPTNLLLRGDGTLVLTDFGIERDLSDNPRLTASKSLVDDLNYVSPEAIRDRTVDTRSDLYSAGVVLYHMLTGSTPFMGPSVTAMLDAHLDAAIPRLPRRLAALQPLVDGMLAKDPKERFQSADDVLAGVEWLSAESA